MLQVWVIVLVMPFIEEYFFRSFLQQRTLGQLNRKHLGLTEKNLVVSSLFSMAHWLMTGQEFLLLSFFPSLFLGWVSDSFKKALLYTTTAHICMNLAWMALIS